MGAHGVIKLPIIKGHGRVLIGPTPKKAWGFLFSSFKKNSNEYVLVKKMHFQFITEKNDIKWNLADCFLRWKL